MRLPFMNKRPNRWFSAKRARQVFELPNDETEARTALMRAAIPMLTIAGNELFEVRAMATAFPRRRRL